jgi:glutamate/tyrosine decarboxylase-like PLP-dependent enzyme
MAMLLVGRKAYAQLAEEQVELARRFAAELTKNGDWVAVTPVDTAIAAVRWIGPRDATRNTGQVDEAQDRIVQRVLAERKLWVSPTTTVGTRAIRVMVISYLTRWSHLEELIAALRTAADAEP